MFSWLNKLLAGVVLGLCGWIWFQSHSISSLKAKNQAQAQTIEKYAEEIERTSQALEKERQAIQEQIQSEQAQQGKANEDIKVINKALSRSDCSRTTLPSDVIKRLQ